MILRYRPKGQESWKQGTVENISRSGVLFRAEGEGEVESGTPIDISLLLELPKAGAAPEVLCWGEIVRSIRKEGRPELAAKIFDYSFMRPAVQEAFDAGLVPPATGDKNLS